MWHTTRTSAAEVHYKQVRPVILENGKIVSYHTEGNKSASYNALQFVRSKRSGNSSRLNRSNEISIDENS